MKNLKCLLVLALLSLSILPVCADVVQISGEIDRRAYLPKELQFQYSDNFHAWLTSSQYCFRYFAPRNGLIFESSYDGNLFKDTWLHGETNSDGTTISEAVSNPDYSPKNQAFPARITVSTNNVPDDHGGPETYLWMAFYGRDYLATNKNLIPPFWIVDPWEQKYRDCRLPAISENLQNDDYRIYYLNDGYSRSVSFDNKLNIEKMNPPFENGYTNLIFLAESVTNICYVPIFVKSVFKNYEVDGKSKKPFLRLLFEIKVTSVKVMKGDFDTNRFFPGEAEVHDLRLPVVEERITENSYFTNAFEYHTSNSGLLYGNELTNCYRARLEEVKEISAEIKKQRSKSKPNGI